MCKRKIGSKIVDQNAVNKSIKEDEDSSDGDSDITSVKVTVKRQKSIRISDSCRRGKSEHLLLILVLTFHSFHGNDANF